MKYQTIAGDLTEMHPSITVERVSEAVYRRITTLDIPASASIAARKRTAASLMHGTICARLAASALSSAPTRSS